MLASLVFVAIPLPEPRPEMPASRRRRRPMMLRGTGQVKRADRRVLGLQTDPLPLRGLTWLVPARSGID